MDWYECTRHVCQVKSINPYVFADVMKGLLARRTGKFCNVMIVGLANYGKTFLLKSLKIIFQAFANSSNKYAWVAAGQTKVIVL